MKGAFIAPDMAGSAKVLFLKTRLVLFDSAHVALSFARVSLAGLCKIRMSNLQKFDDRDRIESFVVRANLPVQLVVVYLR